MSMTSRHMGLADVLAEINGDTADAQARAHLAACADCRAETDGWAAVADGVSYLAASIRVPPGAIPEAAPAAPRRRRGPGRRSLIAAASAAAVVAAVLAFLLPGHSRLTGPLYTRWQADFALPHQTVTGTRAATGAWRLASYLVTGWQRRAEGVPDGFLTCPVAGTCYVLSSNTGGSSWIPDLNTLDVSTTGGIRWSGQPVPSGLTFTSALSCGSATDCAAGGLYLGQPVFAGTADGGHSWTIDPLPAAAKGVIFQLSCPTISTCNGLMAGFADPATFLRTTNAGRRFVISKFPAGQHMQTLSCPTATDCVAMGLPSADLRVDAPVRLGGVVETSTDGGATWKPGRLPGRFGAVFRVWNGPGMDCPDARYCFAIGTTNLLYQNAFAASADGGRTWTIRQMPRDAPDPWLNYLSCPTGSTCYVAGSEGIPQFFAGGIENASSAMLLATSNGGESWNRVRFAVPTKVTQDEAEAFASVGDIQCPRAGACVALGINYASKSTPVYTLGSAP